MKISNLPALIPGTLESLQPVVNANLPALSGLPTKAIAFRNIAGASGFISGLSLLVSANIENKCGKAVAVIASVAFASLAAISTKGCLKTIGELESWLDKGPDRARSLYQADDRIIELSTNKKEV